MPPVLSLVAFALCILASPLVSSTMQSPLPPARSNTNVTKRTTTRKRVQAVIASLAMSICETMTWSSNYNTVSYQDLPAPLFPKQDGIVRIATHFIIDRFGCPAGSSLHLPAFISNLTTFSGETSWLTIGALLYLQRLKARFPKSAGCSGYRLFLVALILAYKQLSDVGIRNSHWASIANRYKWKEVNEMEKQMCRYLDWDLVLTPDLLRSFRERLYDEFPLEGRRGPGPCYPLGSISGRSPEEAVVREQETYIRRFHDVQCRGSK